MSNEHSADAASRVDASSSSHRPPAIGKRNCAIDYFPSAYSTQGQSLMGMQSANEGLIKSFLRYADVDSFHCHVRSDAEFRAFRAAVSAAGRDAIPVSRIAPDSNSALRGVGALLHPFPGFGPLAWVRRFSNCRDYSLLGITHTTATTKVMDSIGNLLIAPTQPWDAVICTSTSVLKTYETVLDHWRHYLKDRIGASHIPEPNLCLIPLGVDTEQFAAQSNQAELRAAWRRNHGIADDEVIALWVGRFSHVAKAHPIPSYLALEHVASRTGRPICFVQAGWWPDDALERAYHDAARRFAPSVRHIFLDGRTPEVRSAVWQVADIFLSLSDNIQETFGLTPIEAMAAGLPAVVSDWDGYRDTVRDGIDGIRVPTAMPGPGLGAHLAHANTAGTISYRRYCGVTGQSTSVDLESCIDALEGLVENADLRRRLGEAGRKRAVEVFDWRVIVGRYQDLFEQLADIRASAPTIAPRAADRPAFPLRADPLEIFNEYASETLDRRSLIAPGPVDADQLEALIKHPMNSAFKTWIGPQELLARLLDRITREPGVSIGSLCNATDAATQTVVMRAVAWLLKMGLASLR